MSTSTLPAKEIERTYMVELTPVDGPDDVATVQDDGSVVVTGRRPYPARRVRLRYSLDEADVLDPKSEQALTEAVQRAIRLERKEFDTARDSEFTGRARLVGNGLVDYLPRTRPQRRRSHK